MRAGRRLIRRNNGRELPRGSNDAGGVRLEDGEGDALRIVVDVGDGPTQIDGWMACLVSKTLQQGGTTVRFSDRGADNFTRRERAKQPKELQTQQA